MMREIDKLTQLAIQAQSHPKNSPGRQNAFTRLLVEIKRSGNLCSPSCPSHLRGSYQEIYEMATQKMFHEMYRKLDDYNPERAPVLHWANFLLKNRFIDAIGELTKFAKGIDLTGVTKVTLDDLERMNPNDYCSDSSTLLSQKVIEVIKEDPDGIFARKYTVNQRANFQYLVKQRIAGYSWKEISEDLRVPKGTLSSFYSRCLERFADIIREYLS